MRIFAGLLILSFGVTLAFAGSFNLTGYIPAAVTPFTPDLLIDENAILKQAQTLADTGATVVFIGGTTGESMSLTVAERMRLAEKWKVACKQFRLKLVIQVGTTTPLDSIALASHAASLQVDAIAAMSPFFFKPTSALDLVTVLAPIAAAAPNTPFYYYRVSDMRLCSLLFFPDIPSMTGVSIAVYDILSTAAQTKLIPTLRGAKFSDSDLFDFGRYGFVLIFSPLGLLLVFLSFLSATVRPHV